MSSPDSRRPQQGSVKSFTAYEYTCGSCGLKYIATAGRGTGCPACASKAATRDPDEITKKVIDDNDLKKG